MSTSKEQVSEEKNNGELENQQKEAKSPKNNKSYDSSRYSLTQP